MGATLVEASSRRIPDGGSIPPASTISLRTPSYRDASQAIRHLPVLEGGRLLGLVSIGDLVKASIADKEFVIEQLENYIRGSLP